MSQSFNELRKLSCSCHLARIVGKPFFYAFRNMSFALKNIHWPSLMDHILVLGRILSYDMAIHRITIEIWFRASIVRHISSASARNNHHFCEGLAVRALKLYSVVEEPEDFCLVMSLRNFCDASLNLLIFCVWLTSGRNCSLYLWDSKLLDQLGDCMLPLFILLLNCWERHAWDSTVHHVASSFPEALHLALCFPRWSCFLTR